LKKDWRQTRWKDFTSMQKIWFCLLCISLVVIIVMACLSTAEVIDIPNWFVLLVVAFGVICLFKFLQLTPWFFLIYGDDQEDEDDQEKNDQEDDDQEDDE